jgi:hypothetical protein
MPILKITLSTSENLLPVEFKPLQYKLESEPYCRAATRDKDLVEIEYYSTMPAHNYTQEGIESIFDSAFEITSDFLETIDRDEITLDQGWSELICNGEMPSIVIDVSDVNIFIKLSESATLTGIEKVIKDCNVLTISNCQILKPTGVLSLLRLKCNVDLTWVGECMWAQIVLKHLGRDKDVMDCHEDLTRAGLKPYAKF